MTWETLFRSGDALNLRVQATDIDGRRRHRVTTGNSIDPNDDGGGGAVVVCTRRNAAEVLLVRQYRAAIDRRLWELPRGVADPDDASLLHAGLRELAEEANVTAEPEQSRQVGRLFPDTGVMGTAVGVIRVDLAEAEARPDHVETDEVAWVPVTELDRLISTGELSDGISLGALAISGLLTALGSTHA